MLFRGMFNMDVKTSASDPLSCKKWAVIMAGGIGERFWPLSTPEYPKQLLPLGNNGNALLQDALERILPLVPRSHLWIATSAELKSIFSSFHFLPEEQIIAEPARRNTAGCLSYIVAQLFAKYGDDAGDILMAVLTADQLIEPNEKFVQTVSCIMDYINEREVLGIIGIPPTRPETGFGYIETGDKLYANESTEIYGVKSFHEKPNEQVAIGYINAGNYFWNSGMFFWKVQTFLGEIKKASPIHWNAIMQMTEEIQRNNTDKISSIFESLPNISIDYALMERAKNIVMAKGDFHWDDLGSWTSLERVMSRDENGNVLRGDVVSLRTQNSIIYNNSSFPVTIVTAGIENLVVVISHNVVLVMNKREAQNLKQVLEKVDEYHRGKEIRNNSEI